MRAMGGRRPSLLRWFRPADRRVRAGGHQARASRVCTAIRRGVSRPSGPGQSRPRRSRRFASTPTRVERRIAWAWKASDGLVRPLWAIMVNEALPLGRANSGQAVEGESRRAFRRPPRPGQAARAEILARVSERASASAGGTWPTGPSRRRASNPSTHSTVANATASNERHGPRRWMTCALNRPVPVLAKNYPCCDRENNPSGRCATVNPVSSRTTSVQRLSISMAFRSSAISLMTVRASANACSRSSASTPWSSRTVSRPLSTSK